jgi:flagellar protein FlbT
MTAMRISLRAGEKIYVNGAVLRVDRKVSLELLNDVTFLLESHVIHADEATTPLRQLYFAVQTMLIDPADAAPARALFESMFRSLRDTFRSAQVLTGLAVVDDLVRAGRTFEALKAIRALFPLEARILARDTVAPDRAA